MFNYSILQNYFLGKVGFAQTANPCYPKIHPSLLSTIGITVQGVATSLLANEVVYDSIDSLFTAPEILAKIPLWDSTTAYQIGDVVQYTSGSNTFVYVALAANTNVVPQWNSSSWETNLSNYLRIQHQYAVAECLAKTVVENNVERNLRSVWSFHNAFTRYTTPIQDTYSPNDFVGVIIQLTSLQNLELVINQIGLQVTDAQTIPFYLFHQSQIEPIASFEVVINGGEVNKFVWKDVINIVTNEPLRIPFYGETADIGGVYYLGFFRDDIVGSVSIWEEARTILPYCQGSYIRAFSTQFDNKPNLPNVGYYGWDNSSNFYTPFNLKLSTQLDYTVNVKQTAQQFYKAIQYEIACKLLMECATSGRVNRSNEIVKQKAANTLKGYEVVKRGYATTEGGLLATLADLKDQLKINLSYIGGNPMINNFG